MSMWMAAVLLTAGAVFDVQEMPVAPDMPYEVVLADLDGSGKGGLAVVQPDRLVCYFDARSDQTASVSLPPETLVLDIADLTEDGRPEVLALTADRLYSAPVPAAGTEGDSWKMLFAVPSLAVARPAVPVPVPLVVRRPGQAAVVAVMTGGRLRLYRPDGTETASYPAGPEAPAKLSIGSPFVAVSVWPPQRELAGLEWRVSRHWTGVPVLPEDLPVGRPAEPPDRVQLTGMARHGDPEAPGTWPVFPLRSDGNAERVLFLYAADGTADSLVRVRRVFREAGRESAFRLSTARRYPGRVIPPVDLPPDFNHDGWSDLLLWSADQPAYTVGTLARTMVRQTWPVHLAVHLFDPDRNAFSAAPAWGVTLEVPLPWMLDALADRLPVRHLVCRDFNGDGRVDIGLSEAPDRYRVWCSSPLGLRPESSETVRLSAALEQLQYATDLNRTGRTSLVFRTEQGVAVLRAQ